MALFYECMLKCARKLLDTADIVREAIYQQPSRCKRGGVFSGIYGTPGARLSPNKRPAPKCWPGGETDRTPSFTASLTDHLQIGYTQVAVLFFACRLLHVAFFLFLCFFLCLGFAVSGTG